MFRLLAYLVLGWLLIAVVGGLAQSLSLTLVLPATSAILLTHAAFARESSTPFGLALAVALGYLEDLHQGAPMGTLSLAHGLAFLALRWTSGRVALPGWPSRSVASLGAVVLIDLLTWAELMVLADALSLRSQTVSAALADVRWHGFATLLAAPPVWALTNRLLKLVKVADRSPPGGPV